MERAFFLQRATCRRTTRHIDCRDFECLASPRFAEPKFLKFLIFLTDCVTTLVVDVDHAVSEKVDPLEKLGLFGHPSLQNHAVPCFSDLTPASDVDFH